MVFELCLCSVPGESPVPDSGLIGRAHILCKQHAPIVGVTFLDSRDGQAPLPQAQAVCLVTLWSIVKRLQRGRDLKK